MKIVVTMTSWKGRISYVAKSIWNFLRKQTVKPDLFYLWLAEEEFPHKEQDLPEDLILTCEGLGVKICWTRENEYCFKRWYIYPMHWKDFVICIDEDQDYEPNTIELGLSYHKKFPNTIFSLADLFYSRQYRNSIHNELIHFYSNTPDFRYCFCGQCIIPPKLFPLDAWTDEQIKLRKEICKKCDESWFNPWLVLHGIKCYCIRELNPTEYQNTQHNALWHEMSSGGYINSRDTQLFEVLRSNDKLMKAWTEAFPSYRY